MRSLRPKPPRKKESAVPSVAGNTGKGSDLKPPLRVSEFTFSGWKGGTEGNQGDRQHMYAVCFGRGYQIKNRANHEARTIVGPISAN